MIYFLIFILQMIVKDVFFFTDVMKIGGHGIGFSITVG